MEPTLIDVVFVIGLYNILEWYVVSMDYFLFLVMMQMMVMMESIVPTPMPISPARIEVSLISVTIPMRSRPRMIEVTEAMANLVFICV